MEDLECGLQLCPKITTEHIQLTPFSLMNVRLAAQVLSSSVSIALNSFGPHDAAGTALYCEMFDKFFDCLNVRNFTEHITKQKPFLKPYSSINDERFDWLLDMFLPYFTNWKESIESRPGIYTKNDKARMFLSWQTYEAILITTHSSIELVKFLLQNNVKYVLTGRFCQDPLENYFGRQRSMGRRRDNPNFQQFGYQGNTIRASKIFRPITSGNSQKEEQQKFEISTEAIPCPQQKRKLEQ